MFAGWAVLANPRIGRRVDVWSRFWIKSSDKNSPDENTSEPLTPEAPELAERIVTTPLDVAVPSPDDRCTAPPVCTVLRQSHIHI